MQEIPAVLFCIGLHTEMDFFQRTRPTPLLRIVDRPIIILILEELIRKGITQFELILHHYPEEIESLVGPGTRWGIQVNYHLVKDPWNPFPAVLPIMYKYQKNCLLLGQGDNLPVFPADFWDSPSTLQHPYLLDVQGVWSGWGLCPASQLSTLADRSIKARRETISLHFSASKPSELLESNLSVLEDPEASHFLPSTAREAAPQVWISRGAIIHPTAELIPPLFIGEECQINAHAIIGPRAVIEHQSFIDEKSNITQSLVCHHSYIGENLAVNKSIVDKNTIANVDYGTLIAIQDDLILSELASPSPLRWLCRIFMRAIAGILFVFFLPLYCILWKIYGIETRSYIKLPVQGDSPEIPVFHWPCFKISPSNKIKLFLKELPSFLPLMKGELHLVGVTPRSSEEIQALPSEWKKLYFHSKVGLITMADLDYGKDALEEERYASDAYYAVQGNLRMDLKLIGRWLAIPWKILFAQRK